MTATPVTYTLHHDPGTEAAERAAAEVVLGSHLVIVFFVMLIHMLGVPRPLRAAR